MKKTSLAFVLFILFSQFAWGFEVDMLNLKMPNQQEKDSVVLHINHTFYGKLNEDPMAGANVRLGMKYVVLPGIELEGSYIRLKNEYTIGAGYLFPKIAMLQSEFNIYYFTYRDNNLAGRSKNTFYQLSLSSEPIWQRVVPVVNAGYDGYNERFGTGLGLNVKLFESDRNRIKEASFIYEYYPIINAETGITQDKETFSFGLKLDTLHHNFALFAGNNTNVGTRRLMLGAPDNNLHFGFNINTRF